MPISRVSVSNFRSIESTGPMPLAQLTVFIGRNNSGKSALLRAMYQAQAGAMPDRADVRLRTKGAGVVMDLELPVPGSVIGGSGVDLSAVPDPQLRVGLQSGTVSVDLVWAENAARHIGQLNQRRPEHLFVPVFARRKSGEYDSEVSRDRSQAVQSNDRNLTSRIAALMSGEHEEGNRFRALVQRVLGLSINVFLTDNGQKPGVPISSGEGIELGRMGEGVSSVLAILADLSLPGPQVFLIEEPETDLHPEALRELLAIILETAQAGDTQFIVSTHSDLVLRTLGAHAGALVYQAEMTAKDGLPTTSYRLLSDAFDRQQALLDLGYQYSMPSGWLVFEESSAETFVMSVLVPAFAPRLAGLKSVGSRGASNVPRTVEDLWSAVLFAHLSDKQVPRAWVLVDGDSAGREAIAKLRDRFKTWPPNHFRYLPKDDIEDFYPPLFLNDVSAISATANAKDRMRMKGELAKKVVRWYESDSGAARDQLGESARDLIAILVDIEEEICSLFD